MKKVRALMKLYVRIQNGAKLTNWNKIKTQNSMKRLIRLFSADSVDEKMPFVRNIDAVMRIYLKNNFLCKEFGSPFKARYLPMKLQRFGTTEKGKTGWAKAKPRENV